MNMGILDLVVLALVTLLFQLSTSYRLNRNQPDLSFGDLSKDYDMIGLGPSFSDYQTNFDDDMSAVSSNVPVPANRNMFLQEINREMKARQTQNDIKQLFNQLKQMIPDKSARLPAQQKRQSGAQICIWKVCPPSPWRRSSGKK